MSFRYIDIHGHVNFPEYDADREEAIERAHRSGVAMITVGTDLEMSATAVQLAAGHEHMWAIIGIHPTETGIDEDSFSQLGKLADHPKVVAIGECGLDYFHAKAEHIPAQREAFEKHIQLADKLRKPLMLHIRNGKNAGSESAIGNAYQDALAMLKKYPHIKANFHFFAGSSADLKDILARGYSVSFTGVISFTQDYDELIKTAPMAQIMSETDCPFVAPAPHRGQRNEPSYVVEVVKSIARIRGEDESLVAAQLVDNAKRFFNI